MWYCSYNIQVFKRQCLWFNNGLGQTTYTDKDGNITTSNTNYLGDEEFSDGTTAKKDAFGNKNYLWFKLQKRIWSTFFVIIY